MRTREEGRIQSPRRAVVPPSSFLRRRVLLTKLFRGSGKKKIRGTGGRRGSRGSGRAHSGEIKRQGEYPRREVLGTPGREPAATRTAASSSGGIVLEGDTGLRGARRRGRGGRRQYRWKKWCAGGEGGGGGKEDVVLFVVHGQYPLVAFKGGKNERCNVISGGPPSLPLFLSLVLQGIFRVFAGFARARSTRRREPGSVQDGTRRYTLRDRR